MVFYQKIVFTSTKLVKQSAMLQPGGVWEGELFPSSIVPLNFLPFEPVMLQLIKRSGISNERSKNGSCLVLSVPQARHRT